MRAVCWAACRIIGVAALAAILVAALTQAGWACSCRPESAEQGFRRAGTIFVGTVIETTTIGAGRERSPLGGAETRVRVEEVIKGAPGSEVLIRHGTVGSLCGVQFRAGQRLTFSTGLIVEGRTGTGYCSQMFVHYRARELAPIYARFRALVEEADRQVRARPDEADAVLARARLLEEWGDLDRGAGGLSPGLHEMAGAAGRLARHGTDPAPPVTGPRD